jgi:hypothetical protein
MRIQNTDLKRLPLSIGDHSGVKKTHPSGVEAHPGVLEVTGAVEAYFGAVDVYP